MSDTTTTTTTTAHTLYRPGDKVRFRFGSSAEAGSLYGTYEGVLSADPWGPSLRATPEDQTMRPEGVTATTAPNLLIISPDGETPGHAVYDITLIERFGLPVWLLDKSREDHAALFAERFRDEVTHALVFTSTSTEGGDALTALTVPYAPSAAAAGWQIGASDLTSCGLPVDHALLGEQGWWVNKDVLREVGVMFPEDLPETKPEADPLQAELERLREQVRYHEGRADRAEQATIDIKREVGTVAMRYAREHGWCGVVREALSDVGIDPVEQKHEVWLTIRVRATGVAGQSHPSFDWTRHSISVDESGIAEAIKFDSDWEDVEVDSYSVEFDVDSVEPLED